MSRLAPFILLAVVSPPPASAGSVVGKLDLPPPPEHPPAATRGFLDRVENPFATVQPVDLARQMVVVLEGDEKPVSPPQVNWDLLGDSFSHAVVAAPVGAEVVIKNIPKAASHTIVAKEDPKLVPAGPINPGGTRSFRVADAGKVYTFGDKDVPHLKGVLVVVNTQYIGYPDDGGRFEIGEVPPGHYTMKIWYADRWLEATDSVNVAAKGKTDVNFKVPAGSFAAPAKK